MQTPLNIVSIGQACAFIQSMPNRIRAAAAELSITPAARINAVDHYDEADLERIAAHLRSTTSPGDIGGVASRAHGLR